MSDLPPLDQAQSYVVVGPDDQRGPYTLEMLVSEVVAGRLDDNTPVWWPGLADWTTMAANPAVAAEIARRRGVQFQAPAPAAPPPPAAPAPAGDFTTTSPAEPTTAEVFGSVASPDPAFTSEPVPAAVSTQEPIDVPAVEVTPADFVAADDLPGIGDEADPDSDAFRSAGAGEGLDPIHSESFADLILRSRARADAASIVQNADEAFVAAIDSAANNAGFTRTSRSETKDAHELTYMGSPGETLTVSIGRVTGHLIASGDGHIDLYGSCASERYAGRLDAGVGDHGEIIIASSGAAAGAVASVGLHLTLADYLDADNAVDQSALERDANAVVASLAHRIRS